MKNQKILTLAFALVIAYSAVVGAEEKFRFAVFSDTRGNLITKSCLDDNAGISSILPIVRDHVLKINETEPIHLVLFPGDMVTGYFPRDADSTAECNRIQLIKWRQMMKPFLEKEIMVRVTIGNHEAEAFDPSKEDIGCGEHGQQYLPSYENFQVFKDALGDMLGEDNGPESDLELTYSFDLDGCHFVVLTSYTMYENNSFSNETINWLDKDLEIAKDKGYKLFVTSHPPAFPGGGHTWDSLPFFDPTYACSDYSGIDRRKDRDRFWNILKKHKVIAYFCGHEHNTQIQLVEGCWHVTIGGLTSELYKFNGVEDDTQRNLILYEGHFQNPKATINWPLDENISKSHWGWALVTVDRQKVTMDVYGTEKLPKSVDDFKKLKTFTLWEKDY